MRNGFRFSLIGEEISYSLSPSIFASIFKLLNLKGRFDLVPVSSTQLHSTLRQLVLEGNRGFSVTIPHKHQIIECLDDIDPIAHKVGAVNSISVNEQRLLGFNTDVFGFAYPLLAAKRKGIGDTALIVGTGGSARAVAHSLYTDFGVRKITVCGRSEQRLRHCIDHLQSQHDKMAVTAIVGEGGPERFPSPYKIVINCTPLGGFRYPLESPFGGGIPCVRGGLYYDLNYNRPNKLVNAARDQGIVAIDGAMMLVAQAIKSFHIWTDIEVPVEPIYQAVFGDQAGPRL